MRKLMLISLAALLVAMLAIPASAEEDFSVMALEAEDVNCLSCHPQNPHTIHAGRPVSCTDCHGEKLTIAIPQCLQCHYGPIHDVHIGKVLTEDCTYCHPGLEGVHNIVLAESVCAHCHRDLIQDHGAEASCTKCHDNVPDIVKPVKTAEMNIVCEACHISVNVAGVHGNESDVGACYGCHRPGQEAIGSQVPHNIHCPQVDCAACHMEQDRIIIPECVRCHQITDLHSYGIVGVKTKAEMQCDACHPKTYFEEAPPTEVAPPEAPPTEVTEVPVEPVEEPAIPGFGMISAIGAIAALYFVSRRK